MTLTLVPSDQTKALADIRRHCEAAYETFAANVRRGNALARRIEACR